MRRSLIWLILFVSSNSLAFGQDRNLAPGKHSATDDYTFRPTVIVTRGKHQGSGTVIASVPGETLVLTAAHVMESSEPAFVEVHRYNLALENKRGSEGWPKRIPATVVATDPAADVAIMRITGFQAMPYVARLTGRPVEPEAGTPVLSVGIDRGTKLSSWPTRIIDMARIDMKKGGGDRPFLLTDVPPDFGRSGGGLYGPSGTVVGVCVGRAEVIQGKRFGIFASCESVHKILRDNNLDLNVARSVLRRSPKRTQVEPTRSPVVVPPTPLPTPPTPGN